MRQRVRISSTWPNLPDRPNPSLKQNVNGRPQSPGLASCLRRPLSSNVKPHFQRPLWSAAYYRLRPEAAIRSGPPCQVGPGFSEQKVPQAGVGYAQVATVLIASIRGRGFDTIAPHSNFASSAAMSPIRARGFATSFFVTAMSRAWRQPAFCAAIQQCKNVFCRGNLFQARGYSADSQPALAPDRASGPIAMEECRVS